MTCTFFGHRYVFEDIGAKVEDAIRYLIEKKDVKNFYVGTHGYFDDLCFKTLARLSAEYDITYNKVLSTVPGKKVEGDKTDYSFAIVPDGIEKAHYRYRINFRNKWMINKSDYVITYVTSPYGTGAALYAELAEKKGKVIIKLGKY